MVVSTGAVRMSVPIVPAQTIKQVLFWVFSTCTVSSCRAFYEKLNSWSLFSAGGTQALDISCTSSHHHSDPATPDHARNSAAPDPAQLHQPPSRHRPGTSAWRRQCGLCSRASTIRNTGEWCSFPDTTAEWDTLYMCWTLPVVVLSVLCSSSSHLLWPSPAALVSLHPLVSRLRPDCHSMGTRGQWFSYLLSGLLLNKNS